MLAEEARRLTCQEATDYYNSAYKKYAESIEVDPDNRRTYENWGVALMDDSDRLEDVEREHRLSDAAQKLIKGHEISGLPSFNLVCVLALQGQTEQSLDELEKCIDKGVAPSFRIIEGDEDLSCLKTSPKYIELLDRLDQRT